MNDDFYKQRAREVRDIAAKADPFIKQRLLDLADRYDGRRKTSITPFTVGAGCRPEPVRRTRRQFRLGPPAVVRLPFRVAAETSGDGLGFVSATGTDRKSAG